MLGLSTIMAVGWMQSSYAQEKDIDQNVILNIPEGINKLEIKPRHHYTENGYPEAEDGSLVIRMSSGEPRIHLRDEIKPYLLYAQYQNQQRDGVFLARTRNRHEL